MTLRADIAPRRAFTLLELLVSMGIGLAVVGVAFAGFRAATQVMRAATRISLLNGQIRSGFLAALDEVDTWRSWDDPDGERADPDLQGRGLRAVLRVDTSEMEKFPSAVAGCLFTPFAQLQGIAEPGGPLVFARGAATSREAERCHDPEARWDAADERTWYHGSFHDGIGSDQDEIGEHMADQRWGRYGIFTSASATPGDLGDSYGREAPAVATDDPTRGSAPNNNLPVFGAVEPAHTWRCAQTIGLLHALGWYGALDYLPRNAVYASYGVSLRRRWYGGRPHVAFQAWNDEKDVGLTPQTINGQLRQQNQLVVPAPTRSPYGTFSFFDDDRAGERWSAIWEMRREDLDELFESHRHAQTSSYTERSEKWRTARLREACTITRPLSPRLVADAPDVTLQISRYISAGRFLHACVVRWADPRTGAAQELTFGCLGTTLRGARQQRRQGVGWARWSSPSSRDRNLDDVP